MQATKMATEPWVATNRPTREQIATLAYTLWEERGCPDGSADEDWFTAEERLAATEEV